MNQVLCEQCKSKMEFENNETMQGCTVKFKRCSYHEDAHVFASPNIELKIDGECYINEVFTVGNED